jgi:hypothetical protein
MLSTEMLDGPQTRTRRLRFSICKISSISVWVLPVPGGPCIKATSGEASAKRIASFWESFKDGSINSKSLAEDRSGGDGEERPNSTRMSGVYSASFIFDILVMTWFILSSTIVSKPPLLFLVESWPDVPLERNIIRQLNPVPY